MQERLIMVENKLEVIDERMDRTDAKLDQIYQKLVGSDMFPIGVVKELTELRVEIENLKKFKMKVIYTVSGFMALGGFFGFLSSIIYNWFTRK